MQDFLTDCIDATALLGLTWFVLGLILNFDRWQRNGGTFHPQPAPQPDPISETVTDTKRKAIADRFPLKTAAAAIERPEAVLTIEVETAPATPNYTAMTVPQLRKECTTRSIRWRNARADGQHLRKREMLLALNT